MKQYDHFSIAGLEESVFHIIVENIDFIAPNAGVSEAIGVGLQGAINPFLHNVGPDVQVLQLGIALVVWYYEGVLLHQILLLFFLGLSGFELLLNFFDESEGFIEVRSRRT